VLKSSSVLGSDRATTDIILMDTILRTDIIIGRTMVTLTTGLTLGMADTDITATIVTIATTTGTN
jgi:hypothetical protein